MALRCCAQFAPQPALMHSKPPLQARLATVEARIRDLEAELAAAKGEVSCAAHLVSPLCRTIRSAMGGCGPKRRELPAAAEPLVDAAQCLQIHSLAAASTSSTAAYWLQCAACVRLPQAGDLRTRRASAAQHHTLRLQQIRSGKSESGASPEEIAAAVEVRGGCGCAIWSVGLLCGGSNRFVVRHAVCRLLELPTLHSPIACASSSLLSCRAAWVQWTAWLPRCGLAAHPLALLTPHQAMPQRWLTQWWQPRCQSSYWAPRSRCVVLFDLQWRWKSAWCPAAAIGQAQALQRCFGRYALQRLARWSKRT